MTTPVSHAKLGLILPAVLNPATAAVLGIGLIAVGLYRMLPDDDEDASVNTVPSNDPQPAALTVSAQLPAVDKGDFVPLRHPSNDAKTTADTDLETAPASTPEADQRETIRKAMSELGKRSAAARAKKKAQQDQVA